MNPVSDHSPLDCYAVLGHPVAHSRSPAIHALFAQQTGQQLHYGRLDCAPGRFHGELQAYAHGQRTDDDGIAGTARGCNITVPYKFEALAQAPRRSPRAELAQAANTLRFDTPEAGGTPVCRWPGCVCCWWARAEPRRVCWARCWRPARRSWWW
jgi:shikimate 5-dehydrogenase